MCVSICRSQRVVDATRFALSFLFVNENETEQQLWWRSNTLFNYDLYVECLFCTVLEREKKWAKEIMRIIRENVCCFQISVMNGDREFIYWRDDVEREEIFTFHPYNLHNMSSCRVMSGLDHHGWLQLVTPWWWGHGGGWSWQSSSCWRLLIWLRCLRGWRHRWRWMMR